MAIFNRHNDYAVADGAASVFANGFCVTQQRTLVRAALGLDSRCLRIFVDAGYTFKTQR